ncbi:hypothetical protein GQ55_7G149500 [Panicum hallii var. hallii]|uniref:F-box domain-containing protein n=1 Tax=Panicum hallii var. hallii TaxID=1504633 RepID=A0A2T7CV77_9POAL|nr:hypothetical protein GQ55_7G149500 [Panicum hallii var. hallii]
MEAPCKRRRGNDDDAGDAGDRDRLSALPDSLLREVMSHMKARQVVQTCVLARRFEDFMDTLLCPGNVSIALLDTLRLHTSYRGLGGEGRRAYRWIRRDIKYHHQAGQEPGLHRGALSCNSWRLRRLHLSNLHLCNLFAEHVRSSCQSLENLELKNCNCEFPAIASGSLKSLVLKCCALKGFREITSPSLKNLFINAGYNTKDCLPVITAPAVTSMFLGVTPYNFNAEVSVSKMMVVCMSLSISHLVLEEGSTTFTQFNNLRALVLNNCDLSDDLQILGHFLHNSPNLERLTLRCCKYTNDTKKKKGSAKSKNAEPTPCPNLVDVPCKNLKLTEIIYKEDNIRHLIELSLRISGNFPNNCIKLTKVV